jgi:hypothetical protein
MNYYESGVRNYPLEFFQGQPNLITKACEVLASENLTPRLYGVEIKPVRDAYDSESMPREIRLGMSREQFDQRYLCFSLKLKGFHHLLFKKDVSTPVVTMNVLLDSVLQKPILFRNKMDAWAVIGRNVYGLTYRETEEGVAELAEITRMEKWMGNLYVESDKPVTVQKRINLDLSSKGFPSRVDWINTFRMYARRIKPDGTQLINAEDVHGDFLIPAK